MKSLTSMCEKCINKYSINVSLLPNSLQKNIFENKLWNMIEDSNWLTDYNVERVIQYYRSLFTFDELKELYDFFWMKINDLSSKFKDLDDIDQDVFADVISRGAEFYENVTKHDIINLQQLHDEKHLRFEETPPFSFVFVGNDLLGKT